MGNKFGISNSRTKPIGNDKTNRPKGSSLVSSFRRTVSLRRMSWIPRPHLDCRTWLTQLELPQYIDAFSRFGGVEEFLYYDEKQIRDEIGVKISSHRARIFASLTRLKEKYEKNQKLKVEPCSRISLNIEAEERGSFELQVDISPGVVLRHGKRNERHNSKKREATVINPQNSDMSQKSDSLRKKEDPNELELRKLLETELSLDASDLRSHAWYHGSISRARAEEVVLENGCFIIRDCISQPGNFVLTCRWNSQVIHVIIQKTIMQPNTIYERIQYKLEDDAYDTISDLVTAYVGSKRPVTILSGARITTPVNRTAPISFYMSKYAAQAEATRLNGTLSRPSSKTLQQRPGPSLVKEPVAVSCSFVRICTDSPPRLRRDSGSVLSQARPSSGVFDEKSKFNGEEGKCLGKMVVGGDNFSSHSLPRRFQSTSMSLPLAPQPVINPETPTSLPLVLSHMDRDPPPKPSRVPSFKSTLIKETQNSQSQERIYTEINERPVRHEANNTSTVIPKSSHTGTTNGVKAKEKEDKDTGDSDVSQNGHLNGKNTRLSDVYNPSGSDSGNGSGDSVQTSASDSRNRDSQFSFCDSGFLIVEDDSLNEDNLFPLPELCPSSAFDLENFSTLLLPSIENRPLDATALNGVRNTLTECGSRILAAHLTKVDLDLLNGSLEKNAVLGVTMGIELITLPHGSQLRKDLIERTECLKLLVAVTILKMGEVNERAEMIYRWIQIAIDTKTAMGNLFGFTGIMLGLCTPEVQRLAQTWHMVRQKYTDSAFQFESKLRATLKAMNEGSNPQAPNTIIPHILPFVLLCERDLEDIYSLHNKCDSLFQWESIASDYGLQMLLSHLQEGRNFTQKLGFYRRNAEMILGETSTMDDLVLDVFRTEFHLKFLFGSKAAFADSEQRLPKFQKVIATLSEFCEPSV